MYAVVETGGKQYRIVEGDVLKVEKLNVEAGTKMEFDKILAVGNAGSVQVGTPYLDAAKVVGTVVEHGKAKKVIIFKYKAKKDYRKKQGHRQPYTMIEIEDISADGIIKPKNEEPAKLEKEESVKAEEVKSDEASTEAVAEKAEAVDNYAIFNRRRNEWFFPEIAEAIVNAAR